MLVTSFGVAEIDEVPEAYGTIPGVYGPFGYGLGLTSEAAQAHAKAIAAIENVAPLPPDEMLAERLMVAVMNLYLPTVAEEQQVLTLMSNYGVKKAVVTLALAAVPPLETVSATGTSQPVDAATRAAAAKKNIKTVARAIKKPPIYKKWWFWGIAATVVATGVVIFTRKPPQ